VKAPRTKAPRGGTAPLRLLRGAQLNWLGRYLPIRSHLPGEAVRSALDVGCGPVGLACISAAPFVGCDVAFPSPLAPAMVAVQHAAGGGLPFVDGAFHTVVCLDVLEHVPPGERAGLVRELCRVAAVQVLLACPVGPVAEAADALAEVLLQRMGVPIPGWVGEHREHGIPGLEEIQALVAEARGFAVHRLPAPGGLAASLLSLADLLPDFAALSAQLLSDDAQPLGRWLDAADFGPPSRFLYRLQRSARGAPVFDADRRLRELDLLDRG